MTSYRRGPSARRTGRSYSDVETAPGRRRRVGVHDEAPESDGDVGVGGRGVRDAMARRGEDEPDLAPVADGGGETGARAPAGAEDEDVDPADPVGAEPGQDRGLVGVAGQLEDDLPFRAAPQPAADGDVHAVQRRVRPVRRGSEDHRGRRDRTRGEDRTPWAPTRRSRPPLDHDDGDGDRCADHHERPGVEHREWEGGAGPGDAADPGEEHSRGHVEGGGRGTPEDPGREAGGESPHHHRPGGGDGEEVGGQRRQRDAAEHRQQHGRHTRLRGEGDGEGRGDTPVLEPRRQPRDPGARRHRQQEPHGAGEQRVDEHERRDRQRQDADRGRRPPEGRGAERQAGHGDGPEHRRLPAGQDAEGHEDPDAGEQAAPQRQPSEHGRGDRQDERHVLPGDGEEVRQAGGPEVVDLGGRLLPVVTEDEAGEEGPPLVRQRGGAAHQRPAELVGEAAHRPAGARVAGRRHDEGAADVTPREEGAARFADRAAAPVDRDLLSRQHRRQHGGGVRRRRHRHPSAVAEAELGAQRPEPPLRVAHQRRPLADHPSRRRRPHDALPRPPAQTRRQDGDRRTHQEHPRRRRTA